MSDYRWWNFINLLKVKGFRILFLRFLPLSSSHTLDSNIKAIPHAMLSFRFWIQGLLRFLSSGFLIWSKERRACYGSNERLVALCSKEQYCTVGEEGPSISALNVKPAFWKPMLNVGKVKVCLTRTAFYFVGKVTRDLATKHQRPIIFA